MFWPLSSFFAAFVKIRCFNVRKATSLQGRQGQLKNIILSGQQEPPKLVCKNTERLKVHSKTRPKFLMLKTIFCWCKLLVKDGHAHVVGFGLFSSKNSNKVVDLPYI